MPHFSNPWKSGTIFDCLDDVDACMITICFPCFVFAENRNVLHGGRGSNLGNEGIDPCLVYCLIMTLSACTLQCLYAYTTRTDIRRKYDLLEEPCDDCSTHFCCHFCALCQEYRELQQYAITKWPSPAEPSHQPYARVVTHRHPPHTHYLPSNASYVPSYQSELSYLPGRGRGPSSVGSYANSQTSQQTATPLMTPAPIPQYMMQQPIQGYSVVPPSGQLMAPQPLIYESHGATGQYPLGNGILPGIPAIVYQVPRYPQNNNTQ